VHQRCEHPDYAYDCVNCREGWPGCVGLCDYLQWHSQLAQLTELVVQPFKSCLSVCLCVNQSGTGHNRYT